MSAAGAPPKWGWHRLEPRWARRIVAAAELTPADLVLDLGAGTGALTRPLADTGASVLAFELHDRRAAALRSRFHDHVRVRVVQADLAQLRLPRRPFRVVANPPFALTTTLLRQLTSRDSRLVRADIVVPRHVAARWANGRGSGRPQDRRRFAFTVSRRIPADAFRPHFPKGAAVLTITRRGAMRQDRGDGVGPLRDRHRRRR